MLYLTAGLGQTLPGWRTWTASCLFGKVWRVGMEGISRRGLCGGSVQEFRGHDDQPWMVQAIVGLEREESQRVDLAKFRFV